MNIIFGQDQADQLAKKYTVLEVDTIKFGVHGNPTPAFVVIETLPINDLPKVANMRELHENLIVEYRKRNWNYCTQAIEHLMGFWAGEMDTFYDIMRKRVVEFEANDPGESWDPVVIKHTA
jgi:hypothetical protein